MTLRELTWPLAVLAATEYTEWKRPLLAHVHHDGKISPGFLVRVGGVHSLPLFTISTITYKAVVNAPAERADTVQCVHSPIFLLYPYMYSVVLTVLKNPFGQFTPIDLDQSVSGCDSVVQSNRFHAL
jgi:hypothetical protein